MHKAISALEREERNITNKKGIEIKLKYFQIKKIE